MRTVLGALLGGSLIVVAAFAQQPRQKATSPPGELVSPDQELGRSFRLTPNDLPAPKATRSVSNAPLALTLRSSGTVALAPSTVQIRKSLPGTPKFGCCP